MTRRQTSLTLNNNILPSVSAFLTYFKGLAPKGRVGLAFGSYGWSGESVKMISESLKSAGFDMIDDGIKALWNPDEASIAKCIEYGKQFATNIPFD